MNHNDHLLDQSYYGLYCQWDRLPYLCPTLEGWIHARDCEITVKGKTYKIKRGDRTDLGTIPWFARWLISDQEPALKIGFIWHDKLCGQYGEPLTDWAEANTVMYWINKEVGQHFGKWARIKRHIAFLGVHLNGLIKGHY